MPVEVVSRRLGHARTSITMDVYRRHITSEEDRRAVATFEEHLFGDSAGA